MRTYKKNLPEGVKKQFGYVRGVKTRFISKQIADAKKKKEAEKKAAKANA
ncbi:MAG: hypothetical protein K6B70_06940 [Clostridia bacterium]|jgi:hypothetical protein|nr:hypothetical protein [Clostridia bacterium]